MLSKIQSELFRLQDIKYRDFSKKIITDTKREIIGVRLPDLRKYAKELAKQEHLNDFKDKYYEEVLLHGLYIAEYRCSYEEKIKLIDDFLPQIDSWGILDSFTASLKFIRKNRDDYFKYLKKYLKSTEFIQRYALVCLLDHYIQDDKYMSEILKIIKNTKYDGYYSKMAGAWLLSFMFIKYYDETVEYVLNNKIDDFVYKKGIQKALESYRLDNKQKDYLRSIKTL